MFLGSRPFISQQTNALGKQFGEKKKTPHWCLHWRLAQVLHLRSLPPMRHSATRGQTSFFSSFLLVVKSSISTPSQWAGSAGPQCEVRRGLPTCLQRKRSLFERLIHARTLWITSNLRAVLLRAHADSAVLYSILAMTNPSVQFVWVRVWRKSLGRF